jgi:hypothetical protein
MTEPNICVQATPVYAFCDFLSQVAGALDAGLSELRQHAELGLGAFERGRPGGEAKG